MTQKQKTHRIAVAALLAAVAAVLQFVEFSIPVMPAFICLLYTSPSPRDCS